MIDPVRRRLLVQAALASSGFVTTPMAISATSEDQVPDAMDPWMQHWLANPVKSVEGLLQVARFADPYYVLLAPITWRPPTSLNKQMHPVTVPRGFVTDLASIPRIFWSIFRPDGDYAFAAVVHDYIYWTQDRTREQADRIFRLAMSDLEISDLQANLLFTAVDTLGESAWLKNYRARKEGERRLISKLPASAQVRWVDWKNKSEAYGA